MQLSGVRLAPWEIELIEKLDDVYIAEYARNLQARTSQQDQQG